MTKTAIIHIRTTQERKDRMMAYVGKNENVTQTEVVEMGVDLFLDVKDRAAKAKASKRGSR